MTGLSSRVLLAAAIGLVPATAAAQTCLRGAPAPRCRQFLVLEMDAYHSAGAVAHNPYVFSWATGGMTNVGPRSAVGGALLVAADDDGHRVGVQGRFRHWLHGRTALDLTPAIFVGGHRNGGAGPGGEALGIAVTHGDLLGVSLNYQMADGAGRLYAGIRFGSWMVPVGIAGLAAAVGATYN
jgi:hypothetical protein